MTAKDPDVNLNDPAIPYCGIGLCNPKSPSNMGSVLRACGCFSAHEVYYTGTRYDRAQKFHTDTANRASTLPLLHTESLSTCARVKTEIVCVELVENAIALPEFVHPPRALYILGPEDSNLSQEIIDQADHVVFIPTSGCLNLSATVHVVLYDRQTKQHNRQSQAQNNKLVRASRDVRNNLVAKESS